MIAQSLWVAWVEREQDNLRVAQEWALEHGLDHALRMTVLAPFWSQAGFGTENLGYVRRTRERAEADPVFQLGITPQRQELLAQSWLSEGGLQLALGDYPGAVTAFKCSLTHSRLIHSHGLIVTALGLLATAYGLESQYEEALPVMEEGIALARQLKDPALLPLLQMNRARLMILRQGYSYPQARDVLLKDMAEFDRTEGQYGSAMIRMALGDVAVQAGEYREAEQFYSEANALFTKYGDRQFTNVSRSGMADTARLLGEYSRAIPLYLEVIASWVTLGNRGAVARCLECLAFIATAQGKAALEDRSTLFRRAAGLFGAAAALRNLSKSDMAHDEKKEYGVQLAELQQLLEPAEFAAAWADGQALDLAQAVTFAGQPGDLLA